MGWDAKSFRLMLRDGGAWHAYRLPKASHSYDGAHGWNTEWPRIREIGGGDDLLMTIHGMFLEVSEWLLVADTSGIAPRSTYLKVIGDFCQWQDRLVFAVTTPRRASSSTNGRPRAKSPRRSRSRTSGFVDPAKLDHFGPVIGAVRCG